MTCDVMAARSSSTTEAWVEFDDAVARAHALLYEAKAAGRDRVNIGANNGATTAHPDL
jgi:PleD family two-component response regulator